MRLYRLLLHAYPVSFRAEYGEEMCALHARRCRDVANPLLLILLWMETFLDVAWNAGAVHLDILRHDLRYAVRTLARAPGFAITAVSVAALGIGATTAAFTMVDHVLIRPLPFAGSDRLVKLWENQPGYSHMELSPANYRDWKRMSRSFETMGCYTVRLANLVGQGDPRQITETRMTVEMLPMLGVKPALGRWFEAADDRENAPATVILSNSLWQTVFGADAGVLGRTVILDDQPYRVIGVMPSDFYFPTRETRVWTAMRFAPADFEERTDTYIYPVARLRPGVTLAAASAEMKLIAAQIQREYPKEMGRTSSYLELLRDSLTPKSKLMLYVLLAAAVCVLLVACTNLANLLLARALARRRELAVRAAMGAGWERLLRQMLTESALLAAAGGVVGVVLAGLALPLLVRLVPTQLPIAEVPALDLRILMFAAATTCGTGIVFGIVPALRVLRGADSAGLREGSRAGVGGRGEWLRSVLVVAEVAGSVVLLVCCGLLIRAMWRIEAVDPGFRAENVLTLRTALPMPKYERTSARAQFYQRVLGEVRRLPGVTAAAYTSSVPMVLRGGVWPVEVEGRPLPPAERQNASLRYITPGYFATLGVPLLAGRDVAESDREGTLMVALVSESFARKYWPRENPIGRRFNFALRERTVAGVVGDVRVRGLEQASEPQVYIPYQQVPDGAIIGYTPKDLVVRSSIDPLTLAPAMRRIIHEADPEQPVSDLRLLSRVVEEETEPRKVQAAALGTFALIAFVLAAVGIHGLLSFAVSSRTQEIGVRMALGATSGDIFRLILRNALALSAIGIGCGGVAAYATGRGLESLLAGLNPADPATFLAAIGLCLLMTLAGSAIPALRAIGLDAATAIRAE